MNLYNLFAASRFGQRCITITAVYLGCIAINGSEAAAQGIKSMPSQPVVLEKNFDSWTVRCIEPTHSLVVSTRDARCEIMQSVALKQDGREVEVLKLAVTAADDKAGKAEWALVALFPLDVLLTADFSLSVGKKKPRLYRFRNCSHLGCFGLVPIDRDLIRRLNDASEAAMFFRLLNGQVIKLIFSLKGFEQAFSSLKSGLAFPTASPTPAGQVHP